MSVYQNLQIAPKEKRMIQLEAVQTFIYSLIEGGHIENEYTIWTGETDRVKEADHYYFKDWSVLSEAKPNCGLQPCKTFDLLNSNGSKNYVFKIHLSKKSIFFKNLEVFNETNFQHFPVFILFFHQPIDYTIERDFWADEGGHVCEKVLLHTNCIIQSGGRNSESSYGLHKEKNYAGFYDYVREMFGEFEMGVYYT